MHNHTLSAKYGYFASCLSVALICLYSSIVQAASQPLLWQVQDKESHVRLYLFGSLHYGNAAFYPLPDAVLQAYREADVLAVELDIDALDGQKVRTALEQHGYYAGEKNLQADLDTQTWTSLINVANSLDIDARQLNQFKPWLTAMQLTNRQLALSDYQQSLGLDKYFLSEARNKKAVLELESLDEQMQLFNQLSDAEQIAFLQTTLSDHNMAEESLSKLADAWYRGDEQALHTLVFSAFRKRELGQKLYQSIFVERNKKMLNVIDAQLKESQKIFLVVGIGHMLGEDGLVSLFEERGYRVTQVNTAQKD